MPQQQVQKQKSKTKDLQKEAETEAEDEGSKKSIYNSAAEKETVKKVKAYGKRIDMKLDAVLQQINEVLKP